MKLLEVPGYVLLRPPPVPSHTTPPRSFNLTNECLISAAALVEEDPSVEANEEPAAETVPGYDVGGPGGARGPDVAVPAPHAASLHAAKAGSAPPLDPVIAPRIDGADAHHGGGDQPFEGIGDVAVADVAVSNIADVDVGNPVAAGRPAADALDHGDIFFKAGVRGLGCNEKVGWDTFFETDERQHEVCGLPIGWLVGWRRNAKF